MSMEIAELDNPVSPAEKQSALIERAPARSDEKPALLHELDELIADATANEKTWVGRNQQLHSHLARGYIIFRQLRADQLETLYRDKGVVYTRPKDGETPDFGSFADVLFGFPQTRKSNTQKVTRAAYKKTLEGLHAEWEANSDKYLHEPDGKLLHFIEDTGGVAGFLKNCDPLANDENGSSTKKRKRQSRAAIDAQKLKAEIAKIVLDGLDGAPAIGKATLNQPVRVGHHNLAAFLGRSEGTSVTILGSSNDPNIINGLLASVGANGGDGAGPALSAILSVVQTQLFPAVALPDKHEDRAAALQKLAELSEVSNANGQLPASDRLHLRAGNQILFSKSRLSASTVTFCKLKDRLIDESPSAYLHAGDLTLLKQWMEDGLLGAMRADPEDRLNPVTKADSNLLYQLRVFNETAGFSKDLHFFKASEKSNTQFQTDFKRDEFTPDWECPVQPGFFSEVREKFTDPWFAELGQHDQILKEQNATLRLNVKSNDIEIVFNLGGDDPPSVLFELPEHIAASMETRESAYRSLDLAPVLYNLADALVDGPITLAGNAHALVIRYANHLGAFEIAIPTLADPKSKLRDGRLFFGFGKPEAA